MFARMQRLTAGLLFSITALPAFAHAHGPVVQLAEPSRTQIVLLGTGTPNANPDRSGPCVAIVVDDKAYLIDCGPGTVRRAALAYNRGVKALEVSALGIVFITHLHSDHTLGYPDLIFTPWVLGRNQPLIVYGPPGIKRMTEHLLDAYAEDIDVRLRGLEPANEKGYTVEAHEIQSGPIYQDAKIKVMAFTVEHGSWKHAFGFRIETPDRVIVVSGDRTPGIDIAPYCQGCDVLIHEVYSVAGFKTRPEAWKAYHAGAHTSSHELGRLAARVKPGLLILIHQLLWGSTPEALLDEIAEVYGGRVVYGNDLDVY